MATVVSSAFLDERTYKIRSKAIPWDGYQRAGLLSQEDVSSLQKVVSAARHDAQSLLDKEGQAYASLYVRLLSNLSRSDTVQYVLVLVGDMLHTHDERLSLFAGSKECYDALLKHTESQDSFIALKSAAILSDILGADPHPPASTVDTLLTRIHNLLCSVASLRYPQTVVLTIILDTASKHDEDSQQVAVQCLCSLFRVSDIRLAAWQADHESRQVVTSLASLLTPNATFQMQYQLVFAFWLLTFEPEIAESINSRIALVGLLSVVAKTAAKEKVVRIALATFRNLVDKAPKKNLPAMLSAQMLPHIKGLKARKWSDEEIAQDVDALLEQLQDWGKSMTTWDEYTAELESGQLAWTPTHRNDDFWRENAEKLNDKDHQQLNRLVEILKTSDDKTVLAVALNDVAQYLKNCDTGKKVLDRTGAKTRVMELMSHQDPDVKYQALGAVQRLISHSWS